MFIFLHSKTYLTTFAANLVFDVINREIKRESR